MIFASYSRHDAPLVRHLVALLRAVETPVFLDQDTIPAGAQWRVEIASALETCKTVLVFWCAHAAASEEVSREYRRAIALEKRVVPVLMDSVSLPEALGLFQGVDLRHAVGFSHDALIRVLAHDEALASGIQFSMTDEGFRSLQRDRAIAEPILRKAGTEFRRLIRSTIFDPSLGDAG